MAKKQHNKSAAEQLTPAAGQSVETALDSAAVLVETDAVTAESEEESQQDTAPQETQEQPSEPKQPWWVILMVVFMRLVVGGVFVFSGFVKAVDPWGSYYKFNEYLQVLGWDSLLGLSTFFAFALAVFEFVLGVLLVTGSCRRVAPLCATAFMLVMTPLTLWLAVTDAVPDCGCFGDYLVLSNWATFGKNVVLLAGCVYLLVLNRRVRSVYGPAVQWMVMALSFAFTILILFTGYLTQPLVDFRPYKVGTQLVSNAASSSDGDYVFIYEKDGVEREFSLDSVPDDDSGWNYVDRRTVKKPQADVPAGGMTIAAWDNGDDMSDSLLQHDQLLLILIPDMDKVSISYTFRINELQAYADQMGCAVAALTSGTDEEIYEWNDVAMAHYPMYKADDSEIKMIARGNPAAVYVRDRKIVWKRTLISIDPELIHEGELDVSHLSDDFHPGDILEVLLWSYLLGMLAVLIVNRTHLVFRLKKKESV